MSDPSQPRLSGAGLFGSFWLGTMIAIAFGYATFGEQILSPRHAGFQCVTLGALSAAMLTLVVRGGVLEAAVLVPAYGLLRLAFAGSGGWRIALSGLLLAAGVFLVALIFDRLGRMGVRIGKFLVAGPLLGGVCLAVAPLSQYHALSVYDSFDPLMVQLFVGIVIGDGAGLGVELAELYSWSRRRAKATTPVVSDQPCPR